METPELLQKKINKSVDETAELVLKKENLERNLKEAPIIVFADALHE